MILLFPTIRMCVLLDTSDQSVEKDESPGMFPASTLGKAKIGTDANQSQAIERIQGAGSYDCKNEIGCHEG